MLDELNQAAKAVAETTAGSIVRLGRGRRGASGIIISERHVVTNAHSVSDDATAIRNVDGDASEATVVGVDPDGDLAVLEAEALGPAISFSEGSASIGTPVFAVAVGDRGPRVTFGVVSSTGVSFRGPRGRRITASIEHTAPLAPGSSGSALVDSEGRLVGINTVRLGRGFYVALPTDDALRARLRQLAAGERINRPRLGITIAPSWLAAKMRAAVGLASKDGLLVREVEPDSPAARSDVTVGDLLIGVDGRPLSDPDDLADAIDAAPDAIRITLVRGEAERTIDVSLRTG